MTAAMRPIAARDDERARREELALAYRALHRDGVDDLTYNHLSARVPGDPNAFLIKRGDDLFEEVTASRLRKVALDGSALDDGPRLGGGALVIHAGLLGALRDVSVVFHTHTPANIAVANHPDGLLPISQHALLFFERIALHPFGGLEFEPGMTDRLLGDLGDHRVALLRNHGALILAESVAEAVVAHHFLEFACRAQVASLAGGVVPVAPEDEVRRRAARQYAEARALKDGGKNWEALRRRAARDFPDYRD